MFDITNPMFQDETKAREHLEAVRWPDGAECPHCGTVGEATKLKGKSTRPGVWKCRACRKPFSVTVGTVFERSKIPLNKWVLATYLMSASKKGMSAHQLHRTMGITYKTAWFMAHRIRKAMEPSNPDPLGGKGKTIEADETYIGKRKANKMQDVFVNGKGFVKRGGGRNQMKVVTLVERDGRAKSVQVKSVTANAVRKVLVQNADRKSNLMTDESNVYLSVGAEFNTHGSVNHSKGIYGEGPVHTNTIEGFFSIFKRGMKGIYQHCGEAHLHRYLSEFDFRYSHRRITDGERANEALKGIEGKRLTYRRTDKAA